MLDPGRDGEGAASVKACVAGRELPRGQGCSGLSGPSLQQQQSTAQGLSEGPSRAWVGGPVAFRVGLEPGWLSLSSPSRQLGPQGQLAWRLGPGSHTWSHRGPWDGQEGRLEWSWG